MTALRRLWEANSAQFNMHTKKMLKKTVVMILMVTMTTRPAILWHVFASHPASWLLCRQSRSAFTSRMGRGAHSNVSLLDWCSSSQLIPQCKASVTDSAVFSFKVLVAVWTQRIWNGPNPGGWHATCTRLNRSEWRSSAKLRPQGIKPGYLCEHTGRSLWLP